VRIRVPGGRLTAEQLAVVADAARRGGGGTIEITNRANLQLRGVGPADAPRLAATFSAAGLSAGEMGDLRRNILLGPLAGLDPTETADLGGLVGAIAARFDAEARLDGLSPKYGIVLDGGGRWHLRARRADAVVTALPGGGHGLRLSVRATGSERVVSDVEELPDVLTALAVESVGRRRRTVAGPDDRPAAPVSGPLGVGARSDPGRCWVGAMPVLGRMDAATATAVAAWADRHAAGRLRLTPWRGVVLGDVDATGADGATDEATGLGLVTGADDPAATVVACAGRGCASSHTDAIADARAVIAARRPGPGPAAVHVSGCEKRCAQHRPAAVTLLGVGAGRYDVLVGDRRVADGERLVASGLDAAAAVRYAVGAA
jgi:precorrin-3B synthase